MQFAKIKKWAVPVTVGAPTGTSSTLDEAGYILSFTLAGIILSKITLFYTTPIIKNG